MSSSSSSSLLSRSSLNVSSMNGMSVSSLRWPSTPWHSLSDWLVVLLLLLCAFGDDEEDDAEESESRQLLFVDVQCERNVRDDCEWDVVVVISFDKDTADVVSMCMLGKQSRSLSSSPFCQMVSHCFYFIILAKIYLLRKYNLHWHCFSNCYVSNQDVFTTLTNF